MRDGAGNQDINTLLGKPMNIFRNATDAQSIAAGTEIFRAGDPGDTMFSIVEGTIEIVLKDRVLETFDAGELFGEMSLIDKSPRSATARAKTDCKLVSIDEKRFLFMVQQHPFFALEMMRVLATRIRHRLPG